MIETALYHPDMPQNVGAMMRLCACLDIPLNIIEPCGFIWKEKEFRRTAMDYMTLAKTQKHMSWDTFCANKKDNRLVILSTKGAESLYDFTFQSGDTLLLGQESKGLPDDIHSAIAHRVYIPMHGEARSLNIVNAAAIALSEAIRQTRYA